MAVIDITNTFIQTQQPNNERFIMHLRGRISEIMCMIAPEIYQPYIQFERKKRVLYVKVLHISYGTLESALLLCRDMSKDLVEQGFTITTYYICVVNK